MKKNIALIVVMLCNCLACVNVPSTLDKAPFVLSSEVSQIMWLDAVFQFNTETLLCYNEEAEGVVNSLVAQVMVINGLSLKTKLHKGGLPNSNTILLNYIKSEGEGSAYSINVNKQHVWVTFSNKEGMIQAIKTLIELIDKSQELNTREVQSVLMEVH